MNNQCFVLSIPLRIKIRGILETVMRSNKILIIFVFTFALLVNLFNPNFVYAQAPSRSDLDSWIQTTLPNFAGGATVADVISALLPYIYGLAGLAILLYAVYGGFQIMTSQGDPKQMAQGRDKITYAVVGFVVMAVSYLIVQLVGRVLDIQQIIDIFG